MSEPARSRSSTPFTGLLDLTQQLTPRKTPRTARKILLDLQSLANDAAESHSALKRQLADVTNLTGPNRRAKKRRMRGNRATEAPEEVANPATLEDRVRKAGRHCVLERALFLFTDVHTLLATTEDANFLEATEFDTENGRIQGQLRDVVELLPVDAKDIRDQEWIGSAFSDGMNGQTSTIANRLRHGSLAVIVETLRFSDGTSATANDFNTSISRFNAFSRRIGYQPATAQAPAFYSMLKAEVLFNDYDGTMDVGKIFRGPLLLIIYVSILRGPEGAKDLFETNTRALPRGPLTQRIYKITHTTPAAIAGCAVWAIWLLSPDTQFSAGGEGDETQIDYKHYYQTFMRQICEGLRDRADWALELFLHWDGVLFPNADDSLGNAPSVNRQAVDADISAMDDAFRAATQRRTPSTEPDGSHTAQFSPLSQPARYTPSASPTPARTQGRNNGGRNGRSQTSRGGSSQSGPALRSPARAPTTVSRRRR
ncbi:hypothetical protein GGX14DRAFT_559494 [Mycena pura]|uniref:Uncharacterized protein n=1 Tax=Mycena pura TaxID=153505 RepID=A0AAD6VRR4_9AGAR|nr:hypothetical protein GGX14DRAFT_559494 [Mycena pura]